MIILYPYEYVLYIRTCPLEALVLLHEYSSTATLLAARALAERAADAAIPATKPPVGQKM